VNAVNVVIAIVANKQHINLSLIPSINRFL